MKTLISGIGMVVLFLLLPACQSGNHVASNKIIQKRKYNKGFHIDWNKKNDLAIEKNKSKKKTKAKDKSQKPKQLIDYKAKENIEIALIKKEEEIAIYNERTSSIIEHEKIHEANYSLIESNEKTYKIDNTSELNNSIIQSNGITKQISNKKAKKNKPIISKIKKTSDDVMLLIGVLLCLVGLSPFGVLVALGKGSEFKTNLLLWILGIAALILGVIMLFFIPFLAVIIYALGGLLLLASFIHGLVVIIKQLT